MLSTLATSLKRGTSKQPYDTLIHLHGPSRQEGLFDCVRAQLPPILIDLLPPLAPANPK